MPKSEAQARLGELMPTLGLGGFERSYPHQLSGGMQQRTALGQALLLSPRVLLLDEPFGALDALTRDRLNVELLRIWEKNKQTLLLITHSITEAVFLSDRVLVMSQRPGQLVHELRIDLPRPRHTRHTRSAAEFGAYLGRLSELMGIE
jgi:NitT/TauT family transport system ATP-binding protein